MIHTNRAGGRLSLATLVVLLAGLHAQAQWQIQSITAVPAGGSNGTFEAPPAITFDSQNRPHVAYWRTWVGSVVHAFASAAGTSGTWAMPSLTLTTGTVEIPSIVHLTAAGSLVYLTVSSTDGYSAMTSAVFDGTAWQKPVPMYNKAAAGGMAIDKTNHVNWIANTNTPRGGVGLRSYHLLRLTDDNQIEPVSTISGISPALALYSFGRNILQADGDMAFDNAGNMHTVQFNDVGSSGFLFYAKGPAGGPFVFDNNVDIGWAVKTGRPGLAVDAAGNPHIVYTSLWPYYRLNYVTRDGTGWKRQTIEGGGKRTGYLGTFPDVLVDANGTVHVVYADGLHGVIKHARLVGSQWQIETIDTVGTQAAYTVQTGALAAAMDSGGGIGAVYWDADDGMLKYAYLPAP